MNLYTCLSEVGSFSSVFTITAAFCSHSPVLLCTALHVHENLEKTEGYGLTFSKCLSVFLTGQVTCVCVIGVCCCPVLLHPDWLVCFGSISVCFDSTLALLLQSKHPIINMERLPINHQLYSSKFALQKIDNYMMNFCPCENWCSVLPDSMSISDIQAVTQ